MTLRERIELDAEALRRYFKRLFELIQELSDPTNQPEDESYVGDRTAFIRPDMASNIYSLVDFWLFHLADHHKGRGSLPLSHRDIRGNNDLDAYHKYLTKVARLQLGGVKSSLTHLHNLRKVRKWLVHRGGHVEPQQKRELEAIPGVVVSGTLALLDDNFIWDSLKHAELYLYAVAEATPS